MIRRYGLLNVCAWFFLTASGIHEISLLLQVLVWNEGTEPQNASLLKGTSKMHRAAEEGGDSWKGKLGAG